MSEIAAILLAAGASRRFGSDKLLHPIAVDGASLPLIACTLQPWLQVFARVTVVVRPDAGDFRRAVENVLTMQQRCALRWVECRGAEQGMAASLACGVAANGEAGGWLIGLADMPAVPQGVIAGIRDAIAAGESLAAPFCDGRRGHPVGFSRTYRTELLALHGDAGARQLLARDAARLWRIETADRGIFTDIDSPADLQCLSDQSLENNK